MVARLALTGRNATYAHEMAHLLTWRFSSHTLREGLADLLALAVHPGAGVRPNVKTYAAPPAVPEAVWAYLGTTRAPPAQLMSDVNFRKAYCYASWRFVDHLVLSKGLPVFLKLYAAADPGPDFERLCGASLADLVALAAR